MKRHRRKVREFGSVYQIAKRALDTDSIAIQMVEAMFIHDIKKAGFQPTEEITHKEIGFSKVADETIVQVMSREEADVIDMAFYTRGIRAIEKELQ